MSIEKALIIGSGVGLRTHFPALTNLLSLEDIAFLSQSKKTIQNCKIFKTLEDALSNFKPDLITVGVPPTEHLQFSHLLKGFKGIILFEKPVGISLNEATEIKRNTSSSTVFVNFQLRKYPSIEFIRNNKTKLIGDVKSLKIIERSSAYLNSNKEEWFFYVSKGGGQRFSMMSHLVDLANYIIEGENYENIKLSDQNDMYNQNFQTICSYNTKTCQVHIDSSSNNINERNLLIELEGGLGTLKYKFDKGKSVLELKTPTQCEIVKNKTYSEHSIFRISEQNYIKDIFLMEYKNLALIQDAIETHSIINKI